MRLLREFYTHATNDFGSEIDGGRVATEVWGPDSIIGGFKDGFPNRLARCMSLGGIHVLEQRGASPDHGHRVGYIFPLERRSRAVGRFRHHYSHRAGVRVQRQYQ